MKRHRKVHYTYLVGDPECQNTALLEEVVVSCCVKAATVMKCLGQARSWDMPYHILSCPRKCLGPARSWDRPALGTCPVKYCKMLDNAWDRPALGTCRAVAEGG